MSAPIALKLAISARAGSPPVPKRVVVVNHTARMGGGEIALLNLLRHLDPRRYLPLVVLLSDGPLVDRLAEAGIPVHVLPMPTSVIDARKDDLGGGGALLRIKSVAAAMASVARLALLMRCQRGDLVHTNSLKADIIGGLAGRLARLPVLWHVRDRIDEDYLPPRVARLFRRSSGLVPTAVVANSAATLRTVALPGQSPRPLMSVVHDGIDLRAVRRGSVAGHAHGPVIGLVGRITRWKGQHVFIRAAELVRRKFPNAKFQIVGAPLFGEEAYELEIRQLVRSLGLEDCIEFTGFRKDVAELVAAMDVLVHASITGEPFGQVIIEGMAAGKPIVATDGGGVPEIVVDELTGLLVPMGEHEPMARAICRLLADPVTADDMGLRGRERVKACFTIQRTAQQIQERYDECLMAGCRARGRG